MTRHEARKTAYLMTFEYAFHMGDPGIFYEESMENAEERKDDPYTKSIFFGVYEHLPEIDAIIDSHSNNWKLERLSKLSISALRVAIYEMLYVEDVDVGVAINEAVELSKEFEGQEASGFVNGILGAYAKTL